MARNEGPVICRKCGKQFESRKVLFDHQRATCSGSSAITPQRGAIPPADGCIIPRDLLPETIEVIRSGGFVAIKVFGHYHPGQGLKLESTELIG